MVEKRVIVYQAYGSQDIVNQTIFSVCSLLKKCQQKDLFEIQIFTDKSVQLENFFKGLSNVKIRPISLEQIELLKGPMSFVHRVKVEILLAVSKEFKGPLYYCDGDTIFLEDPTELFLKVNDRISIMHTDEGVVGKNRDPLSKKIAKFLKHRKFHVGGQDLAIGQYTEMWNAGFIGMSEKNKSLLPNVLELTDRLYHEYQKHIMEQLAFSFYLQTNSQIIAADRIVFHYWSSKQAIQSMINEFLQISKTAGEALLALNNWKLPPLQNEKNSFTEKVLKPFKKMFTNISA